MMSTLYYDVEEIWSQGGEHFPQKFIKGMMTTISFITDASNIENQSFIDFRPDYRSQLIIDVGVTLLIPVATIRK